MKYLDKLKSEGKLDLYTLEEEAIVSLLKENYSIWQKFTFLDKVESSNSKQSG